MYLLKIKRNIKKPQANKQIGKAKENLAPKFQYGVLNDKIFPNYDSSGHKFVIMGELSRGTIDIQ